MTGPTTIVLQKNKITKGYEPIEGSYVVNPHQPFFSWLKAKFLDFNLGKRSLANPKLILFLFGLVIAFTGARALIIYAVEGLKNTIAPFLG